MTNLLAHLGELFPTILLQKNFFGYITYYAVMILLMKVPYLYRLILRIDLLPLGIN